MGENEIALVLRLEKGKSTINEITDLDNRLRKVKETMREMRKVGKENTEEFKDLAIAERSLTLEKRELNKELNKSVRDFKKFGGALPTDSMEAFSRRAEEIRRVLRRQSASVIENNGFIEELGMSVEEAVRTSEKYRNKSVELDQDMGVWTTSVGRYSEGFKRLTDVVQQATGLNLGNLSLGGGQFDLFSGTLGDIAGPTGSKALGVLSKLPTAYLLVAAAVWKVGTALVASNEKFDELNFKVGTLNRLSGSLLHDSAASIETFSTIFGKSQDIVLESANAVSRAFGVTIPEAIDAMKVGIQSGADLNGEFLQQMREYPKLIEKAGFTLEEFVALTAESQRRGIFNDKLIDTIKESDIALGEFTQTQRDALAQVFGLDFADSIYHQINTGGATTKEILQQIAAQSDLVGVSVTEQGLLVADVFKAAGEDAGGFIEVLSAIESAGEQTFDTLVDGADDMVRAQNEAWDSTLRLNRAQSELATLVRNSVGTTWDVFVNRLKTIGFEILQGLVASYQSFESIVKAITSGGKVQGKTVNQILFENQIATQRAQKEEEKLAEIRGKLLLNMSKD